MLWFYVGACEDMALIILDFHVLINCCVSAQGVCMCSTKLNSLTLHGIVRYSSTFGFVCTITVKPKGPAYFPAENKI